MELIRLPTTLRANWKERFSAEVGLFLQSPLNKRLTHSLLSTPKMIRRLCSPTDPDTEIPKARGARRKRKTKGDLKGAAEYQAMEKKKFIWINQSRRIFHSSSVAAKGLICQSAIFFAPCTP